MHKKFNHGMIHGYPFNNHGWLGEGGVDLHVFDIGWTFPLAHEHQMRTSLARTGWGSEGNVIVPHQKLENHSCIFLNRYGAI